MSIYDKASLVLIPSGTKTSKVYSQKPVPEYGAELVTNGGFSSGTGWSLSSGWSIASGKATASSTNNNLQTSTSIVTGDSKYLVSFEISNYSSGTLYVDLGTSSSRELYTSNGFKSIVLTAGGFNKLRFYGGSISCDIDNVSVKEVLVEDGDFTFSRSTAATRVNADGNIEKQTGNYILYSQQIDNSYWNKYSMSVTANQAAAPDGTTTADLIDDGTGTGTHAIEENETIGYGGAVTISIHAKYVDTQYLVLAVYDTSYKVVVFDIQNGTIGNKSLSSLIATIEDLGSGWYRCAVTHPTNTRNNPFYAFGLRDDNVAALYTSAGSNRQAYVWGAQMEDGLVARDYIETTTAAVEGGITDNVPRLDYTDSSCPSLLLEPSRTNILEYSEYLDGVPYKSRVNITNNAIVSPEGVQNAAKVIPTSVSGTHALDYIPSVVVSDYTMSVYAKAGEYSKFLLLTNNRGSNEAIGFDLSDASTFVNDLGYATPSADAVSIEAVGNGWYRCSMKYAKDSTGGSGNGIYLVNDAEQTTFVGNDSDGIYFWGWQMEAGSYQTSYIPTYGTSVTRNNDETDVTGLQSKGILSSTQGTMFFHITDIEGTAVVFNAQTANDLSYALRFIARDNGFQTFQRVNDVQTTIRGTSSLTLSEWKIAMSWNGTNLITSLNGTSYIDTIDASIASQLDAVKRVNPQAIYVTTNQILVFPTQLTEAELNDLTTL